MIFDTHMHCNYSCDSHMDFHDAIEAARQQNIGVVFTEHWDFDYPTNPEAFIFDIDEYFAQVKPLCSDKILIGIEIGMQNHTAAKDELVAAGHPFDFVLGSIHCVQRQDIYEKDFYQGRTKQQATRDFLADAICCVENHDNFDAFAHIDYICRYWPYEDKEFNMEQEQALFDKLLLTLIAKQKPMEINTRRLDDGRSFQVLLEIYRRYRQLGGRFCTVGSDAHYQEHVGRRLDKALELAMQADLQPVYFRERKMYLMGEA